MHEKDIASNFPLHYSVWKDDSSTLLSTIEDNLQLLESFDPRGRTPLMLAVTLEHVECARILLSHGANVNVENKDGWTVVQEAVATGNHQLVRIVLGKRDHQRYNNRMMGVPLLLHKLKEAPDFYLEMKWEFTSWVPLVSRMCPSDTYKIYKQGSNVRIDTTLLGFEESSWQRGNKSYVFKAEAPKFLWGRRSYIYKFKDDMETAVLMELDHEAKDAFVEELKTIQNDRRSHLMVPGEESVVSRLTAPIVHTYVDTEKISFERSKSGLWGWRSDKEETINGYECKVFSASNVELVTKTRTEHLSGEDKNKAPASNARFPLNSLLAVGQSHDPSSDITSVSLCNPENVTMKEYFDVDVDLASRDIGKPKELTTKIQKFRAALWLCEEYPLSLADQIMPIIDLMAISSTHFAKLRDFIQMQLPSGFPTKIEIPLFHVMNACVTFGNIFGLDEAVHGISAIQEEDRLSCAIDDSCFQVPNDYSAYGMEGAATARRQFSMDEEDELLQYAIQQSVIDAGSENDEVDIWEALKAQQPSTPQMNRANRSPLPPRASSSLGLPMSTEEQQLQRYPTSTRPSPPPTTTTTAAATATAATATVLHQDRCSELYFWTSRRLTESLYGL